MLKQTRWGSSHQHLLFLLYFLIDHYFKGNHSKGKCLVSICLWYPDRICSFIRDSWFLRPGITRFMRRWCSLLTLTHYLWIEISWCERSGRMRGEWVIEMHFMLIMFTPWVLDSKFLPGIFLMIFSVKSSRGATSQVFAGGPSTLSLELCLFSLLLQMLTFITFLGWWYDS